MSHLTKAGDTDAILEIENFLKRYLYKRFLSKNIATYIAVQCYGINSLVERHKIGYMSPSGKFKGMLRII